MAAHAPDTVELDEGRTIRPPTGWQLVGAASSDPLSVQPDSRIIFQPGENAGASICWRTAKWLSKSALLDDFLMMLDTEHHLSSEELESLYPDLIKVPPETVSEARVMAYPGCGRVLAVTYLSQGWAGHALYMPTGRHEGELQILSFEGTELPYLEHFEAALASMATFKDDVLLGAGG